MLLRVLLHNDSKERFGALPLPGKAFQASTHKKLRYVAKKNTQNSL